MQISKWSITTDYGSKANLPHDSFDENSKPKNPFVLIRAHFRYLVQTLNANILVMRLQYSIELIHALVMTEKLVHKSLKFIKELWALLLSYYRIAQPLYYMRIFWTCTAQSTKRGNINFQLPNKHCYVCVGSHTKCDQ